MAKLDVDGLLVKAKEGRVTKGEINAVVSRLTSGQGGENTYALLYVVGRSFAVEHEDLVVGYLESGADPVLAGLSLRILCTYWDLTERYIGQVERFLAGVDWDDSGDVQLVAIGVAGEFLRDHVHCGLLGRLVELCGPDDAPWVERRIALGAVARALGMTETLGSGAVSRENWSADVLSRAKARLVAECV